MTEESGIEKDSVYEGDNAPNEIITESGLDAKQVENDDSDFKNVVLMLSSVPKIQAGPSDLLIFEGDHFDIESKETQEFNIYCGPAEFRVRVWSESGERFFEIGDIFDYLCSEPVKLNGEGTFIDIIRTPQGSIEILGWIIKMLPVWMEIKLAIDAIRLILEDHDRIHDPFYLDRIYNVWDYDPDKFEFGVFRKMVESRISEDAVRLIPELSQKCQEKFFEVETKFIYEYQ